MRDWSSKRYWIIGASEGLGLALAQKVHQQNDSFDEDEILNNQTK